LITVGLVVLCSYLVQSHEGSRPTAALSVSQLQATYDSFNEEYFNNSLPKNTVVDYGEYDDDFMGTTQVIAGNRFHIALNESYTSGARNARLTLLHEQCHIKTWQQEIDEHGKRWRSCMLSLDAAGAFREQIIDGYREH
jgi:hypothetical protein